MKARLGDFIELQTLPYNQLLKNLAVGGAAAAVCLVLTFTLLTSYNNHLIHTGQAAIVSDLELRAPLATVSLGQHKTVTGLLTSQQSNTIQTNTAVAQTVKSGDVLWEWSSNSSENKGIKKAVPFAGRPFCLIIRCHPHW